MYRIEYEHAEVVREEWSTSNDLCQSFVGAVVRFFYQHYPSLVLTVVFFRHNELLKLKDVQLLAMFSLVLLSLTKQCESSMEVNKGFF